MTGTVAGREVLLLVDTGTEGIVLFAEQAEGAWLDSLGSLGEVRAAQMTGAIQVQRTRPAQVLLGGAALRKQSLYLVSTGRLRFPYDGILGLRALHSSRVQFDLENMLLSWER